MRRLLAYLIFTFLVFFLFSEPISAAYSLPYPSYMPGNKLYAVSRLLDAAKGWWSWGTIATLKYNESLGDKYIVEAKTLFEYKQYLLAVDALKRSDARVAVLPALLQKAKDEKKDIAVLEEVIHEELSAHIDALDDLKGRLPSTFVWQPEKSAPTNLPLGQLLDSSKAERVSIQGFHVQ